MFENPGKEPGKARRNFVCPIGGGTALVRRRDRRKDLGRNAGYIVAAKIHGLSLALRWITVSLYSPIEAPMR
jgi:hypothetical protein